MFGLSAEKLLVIAILAVLIVGPQRLPQYAAQLASWVKAVRSFLDSAKERINDELDPESQVDWARLDPRQYDPRRIIRSALLDDPETEQVHQIVRSPAARSYDRPDRGPIDASLALGDPIEEPPGHRAPRHRRDADVLPFEAPHRSAG